MKRKLIFTTTVLSLLIIGIAYSAIKTVYIRYYNKDSKSYTFNAKIGGSTTTVEFGSSRTASVTIQGGGSTAVIETNCGNVTVKDGDNIEIKDGCISIK